MRAAVAAPLVAPVHAANADKPSPCHGDEDAVPLLEFRNVSRLFTVHKGLFGGTRSAVRAVEEVSLQVQRGETLGLVGESGCGKSTLARMAVRLLAPSSGDVLLDGYPLHGASLPTSAQVDPITAQACTQTVLPRLAGTLATGPLAHRLQMIFQDPFSSLNPRLRVGSSIAEPLATSAVPRKERQAQVAEILELVGLRPEHASRYPHEFSGGQRQRIAIARALITRPELVVCDEAVSALDASVQAQVLNLLKDAQTRFGLTYLFISHDLAVVGYMSDRVAVMYLGRLVEQADRKTLFDAAAHPYTRALLEAAPVHDPALRSSRPFLPGEMPSPFEPPSGCAFHPRCPLVMPQCREHNPKLQALTPTHLVRCHLYGQSAEENG